MILDLLLNCLAGLLSVLLLPLQAINISVDFVSSIPFVVQFFNIIAYIIPWSNFMPLFALIIGIVSFKILIATIKTIWALLPMV